MSSTPEIDETIQQLVHKARWRTTHNTAFTVNVSYGTVQYGTCTTWLPNYPPQTADPETKGRIVFTKLL